MEPFRLDDLVGEVMSELRPPAFADALRRLVDPGSAITTLHWGRNYLYTASWPSPAGELLVVVKQFRNQKAKDRLRRWLRGTKAECSWRAALSLIDLGLATPEPILYADSVLSSGPSFFVTLYRPELLEARYWMRALNARSEAREYPEIDTGLVLRELGRLARELHQGRFFHRDLSSGNLLIDSQLFRSGAPGPSESGSLKERSESSVLAESNARGLYLVDLNRARIGSSLSLSQRMRDLSRMPLDHKSSRRAYLDGYWAGSGFGRGYRQSAEALYELYRRAFLFKNRSKQGVRGLVLRVGDALLPRRRPHVHIEAADPSASRRDKVVWDPLSDQPHQHAARWEKLLVRTADAPTHARALGVAIRTYPKARRRLKELRSTLGRVPVPFGGVGLSLRPWPDDPESLLAAVAESGARKLLIRLHPWQDEHDGEEELARELVHRGYELAFSLPQSRDLVRDPRRWRASIEEIAERFVPLGRYFQIGQAVNRSKWGIWRPSEYVTLYRQAAEALRQVAKTQRREVELLGPAVIDYEAHATATLLNLPADGLEFDILASLLYVDRRGAPENQQLGLDTAGKVLMLKALAETSRNCPSGRSWITEMNWPLREGPHSPAGRDVAVSEELQASYLVRYYLEALSTGLVERVYWWQLIHKGYGLIDPDNGALRRRPAFEALARMTGALRGAAFEGSVGTANEKQRLYRFRRQDGGTILVGWSTDNQKSSIEIPGKIVSLTDRDGRALERPMGRLALGAAPVYIEITDY